MKNQIERTVLLVLFAGLATAAVSNSEESVGNERLATKSDFYRSDARYRRCTLPPSDVSEFYGRDLHAFELGPDAGTGCLDLFSDGTSWQPARHRFLRIEKGVPVYDAGSPAPRPAKAVPRGLDGSPFRCANVWCTARSDMDGDGIDDLILVSGNHLGVDDVYPWARHMHAVQENALSGKGRGYDIFGKWLGMGCIAGIRWAKGVRCGGDDLRFEPERELLMETPYPDVRAAFVWKTQTYGGIDAACTVRTKTGLWLVLAGDVDKLVALPLAARQGDVFCGKPRPLLKDGYEMPFDFSLRSLRTADVDGDGRPEIFGESILFRGDEPGGFSAAPVLFEGGDVCTEGLSSPWRCDWDKDGIPDLIQGDAFGWLTFWKGTDRPTVYRAGRKFRSAGREIRITAGDSGSIQGPRERGWGYLKVIVGDWGGREVMITCDIQGRLMLYGRAAGGDLLDLTEPKPFVHPDGRPFLVAWRSRPDFVRAGSGFADVPHDSLVIMDAEGDLALAVPSASGGTVIAETRKLRYRDGGNMRVCGPNGLWGRGHLACVDWDGDGLQDLVFGTNRACIRFFSSLPLDKRLWEEWYATPFLFRNVGEPGRPRFARAVPFVFARDRSALPFGVHNATPCVTDLDRDGRPDLLIGAENGKVYFFGHGEIVPSDACSSDEKGN